jgi:hypothetical protein
LSIAAHNYLPQNARIFRRMEQRLVLSSGTTGRKSNSVVKHYINFCYNTVNGNDTKTFGFVPWRDFLTWQKPTTYSFVANVAQGTAVA